ncbi:hypothetical protein DM860_003025 [Cuscuta australis]|uniref:Pentacotripeptide-repeat region of PRORP domain-containing protein n=1 Tax=Cuscuta australis TaxID=267555 RepID=A0A328D156_9ASTE|nr:hypothetical protein DM860_003025 [Cuscuta australis]
MIFNGQTLTKRSFYHLVPSVLPAFHQIAVSNYFKPFSTSHAGLEADSDLAFLVAKISPGSSEDEVFLSLQSNPACETIRLTHKLVGNLLHCFKDDWKSALGAFRWADSHPGYTPLPEFYDEVVDILGKMKKMDRMCTFLDEMCHNQQTVTLSTIAKVMRRFAGAGKWKEAVRIFDELGKYGIEKNTESMNLLLDTLCKSNRTLQAREIFLELKSHIPPNPNTFNIFIHGWCKANSVDEALWTIQEMKGYGFHPCIISYSTIIRSYCNQSNFPKVYELLDEMKAEGCEPNAVTFTTIISSLTKLERFEEALEVRERMRSVACKPDTLFYNALIYTLGRSRKIKEAICVLKVEMPTHGVKPNTSTYNSLIATFCLHRQEADALECLREMESSPHCEPDAQTYYPLLKLCFINGKTDDLLPELMDEMVNRHHLSLDLSAYSLLIHGLCRSNKCEWAYRIFEEMIAKEITPRYQTCKVLLEEIKQKNMFDVADRIEEFMKKMK